MLVLLKLYPNGDMLVNPEAILWAKPIRFDKVVLKQRNHEDKERTEFLLKEWDVYVAEKNPVADCSLKEFYQLMGSE